MDFQAYHRRLWIGSVTAPETIRWFVPMWAWFAFLIWSALRKESPTVLFVAFWVVALASMVPFFCRRVGLLRFGVFVWVVPAVCAAVVTPLLRMVFHLA